MSEPPTDPSDAVAGARHVGIVHELRLRKFDVWAWVASLPVFALGGLTAQATYPWTQLELFYLLAGLATVATPFLIGLLAVIAPMLTQLARGGHSRGLRVNAGDRGLEVIAGGKKRYAIPWSDVGVAWLVAPRVVELVTASGDELSIVFDTHEQAADFVASVRGRAKTRRAYPLNLEADWARLLRKSVATLVPSVFASVAMAVLPLGWPAVPLALSLSWAGARGKRSIELGADGVVVHYRLSQRYVPYREIAGVELEQPVLGARSLALVLHDGKRVSIARLVGPRRAVLAKALLEEGIRMAREGAAAGAEVSALARQEDESDESWRARVLAAARRSGYRGPALDPETLVALMRNPAADAEQRIAAALAMRSDPAGAARIRVAAQVSTEPDVREALEALGEEEVDEQRVSRALRKLATAKR